MPHNITALRPHHVITPDGGTVGEFWQWGFGDLRSNVIRGVLAEYLVGRALGVDLSGCSRVDWDNFDVLTRDGLRIEVKCGAYVQAWEQRGPSNIVYSGLTAREWSGVGSEYSTDRRVRADVFVFSLETCAEPSAYQPLELSQWEFRVAAGTQVRGWGRRSVSLGALMARGVPVTNYHGLADVVRAVAEADGIKTSGARMGRPVDHRSDRVVFSTVPEESQSAAQHAPVAQSPLALVGLVEVAQMMAVQTTTAYRWRSRGRLPEPEWILSGSPLWRREVIEDWGRRTGRLAESHCTRTV